jgi:hypothetical protein
MLTIRSISQVIRPNRSAAAAASVAMPWPQNGRPSRQAISTVGMSSGRKYGTVSPVKPASSPVWLTCTANSPYPLWSHSRSILAIPALVCSRSRTVPSPIQRMTSGSELNLAIASTSLSCQRRSTSLAVRSVVTLTHNSD